MDNTLSKLQRSVTPRKFAHALRNPRKFRTFVRGVVAARRKDRLDYAQERRERPARLADVFDAGSDELRSYQREIESDDGFYEAYDDRHAEISEAVDTRASSRTDCQTLYVAVRALEPETVVLTGVRFGAFDAHAMRALERNGHGECRSLDLPGGPEAFEYGYLIPNGLREDWHLHLGDARDVLPGLLDDVAPVGLFVHDSLHTPEHMRWEYETALPYVREGGAIASHDVLTAGVFDEFADAHGLDAATIANTGVASNRAN